MSNLKNLKEYKDGPVKRIVEEQLRWQAYDFVDRINALKPIYPGMLRSIPYVSVYDLKGEIADIMADRGLKPAKS